jgi:phospholipase C
MPIPITRVVVLMMENHSFDRVLGWMRQTYAGVEGVDPSQPGWNPDFPVTTHTLFQAETVSRNIANDPGHDLDNVLGQIAGGNQGFVADFAQLYPQAALPERKEIMGWYPYQFLPALHFLAYNFVVCDHWFASVPGPTWPNRFFVHSGTSLGHVDMPEGTFNPHLHWYDQRTLYDELDDANVDWRIYHGDFPQSLLMVHQWDKLDHYRKFDQWAADAEAGNLPPYVFIEPTYFGTKENDQHPPQDVMRGDLLVAEVFNSLLANRALFEETLLIVLYDEHGGFYDHVPPLNIPTPLLDHGATPVFATTGVRVPGFVISPLVEPGSVFNPPLDHTSFLQLIAEKFGQGFYSPAVANRQAALARLSAAITRATPRTDIPAAPAVGPAVAPMAAASPAAPGANANAMAFRLAAAKIVADHPGIASGWPELAAAGKLV